MSDVHHLSKGDSAGLRQRLAGLSADQRALLVRRLGQDRPEAPLAGEPHAIPRARPLRVEADPCAAVYPASHGQQRMWFLHHYASGSPVYCVPSAFRLSGSLDVACLEAAFQAVIQRHDVLRTTFAMDNGELFQRVDASSAFQLRLIDLDAIPADTREASAEQCLAEEARRPFDLAAGPLFRAVLVRLRPTEHVLLLVLHHIMCDGWSRSNIYRELSEAYEALASGRPAPADELPIQFADYSAWQKDWFDGGALAAQTAYWMARLGGEPEPLDLPSDRPRPATESFRGCRRSMALDPLLIAALTTRAQEEGATLFMILLAAFKVLLHRYTGHDDLIVGVPIANRRRMEVERLIGFFANTLAMRTSFLGDPTFRELLRRVKETAVEAYENQDMPFEQLVELLHVRRDASRTPLFQASFALQDYPAVSLRLPGIQTTPWPVTTGTSKFDLGMAVERSADGWTATVEYSTDLFDVDRVERMLGHWRLILEGVVADPDQRVSEIPLLTAAERHQVLVAWNRTERDYPRDACVHELFKEQVDRTPDAVAVVCDGRPLSYRDLDHKADRLALHLRLLGVVPGDVVGIRVERSFEMVIGLLGILKAGGVYWALEENLPEERLRLMLADARPRVLLTRRAAVDTLPDRAFTTPDGSASSVTVAVIEELLESPLQGKVTNAPRLRACDPAYVSYTSGSTGQPKGVLVPHRGVARLVKGTDYVSLTAQETLLHWSPLSFDASTFELWGGLLNGGRVVLLPPGQPSLGGIGDAIRQHGVTALWLTAGLFHLMVDERLDDLKPLRQLLAGGDVLSPEHVLEARRSLPGCRIINGYGPTENTTFTCCHTVGDEGELIPSVPIGRPIANTRVYVLDPHGQPVPIGVAGELYAGGDGLAIGYLNEPELTVERFVPDPFSSVPGARLYRTGDLVRWRADGDLEFLGRMDSQVKVRGFRVELGEVEGALCQTAGVLEAAVAVKGVAGEKRLVAYVVADPSQLPGSEDVVAALKAKLPEYMIPARIEYLSALPLTPSGKVDRRSLPEPALIARAGSERAMPARSLLESELTRLWQRLFQREHIDRDDNFFDLGGHSLLAMRMVGEVEDLVGRRVPISALFQAPSIAALARRLADEDWVPSWSSLVPLQPMGSEPAVFCVHGLGGDVYGFLDLARELAPDRPVYGLQAVGLDGGQPQHTTVEDMATHYAREIRSLQPEGPYHLVGASQGGWIAYAVAQELTRQGRTVALLGLLDTRATSDVPWTLYARVAVPYLVGRLPTHLKRYVSGPSEGRLRYLGRRLASLRLHVTRSRADLPVRPATAGPVPAHDQNIAIDYFEAVARRYRPAKYAGDVTLFAGGDARFFPHHVFWKHLVTGRVQVRLVSGDHGSIINDVHAVEFALVFRQALLEAEATAERSSTQR